ncbi:MAG: hypothetical protein E7057_02630 [Lentisphaerae bacterium]|nr:hypothetical protein [Lentisphaerota bacterium]
MQLFSKAVPVWSCAEKEVADQYRLFRKEFVMPETFDGRVYLNISADSTYTVFINAARVKIQQIADFPGDLTVSQVDISSMLKAGKNVIAAEVHYNGERFLTYRPGTAFICAEITDGRNAFVSTDESWKCCVSPDMQSGLNCKLTSQLGFVFCKDARKSVAFADSGFDDSAWQNAVRCKGSETWKFSLRSVPQLKEFTRPDAFVRQMGYLKRAAEEETFAVTNFRDFLAPRRPKEFFSVFDPAQLSDDMLRNGLYLPGTRKFDFELAPLADGCNGYYLILDMLKETVGFIDVEICLPDGAVVDISHGEHLEDGRVSSLIGNRNFTDRFIAKAGWNHIFCNHRRIGCRYVELHITNCGHETVQIRYAGVTPLELPLPSQAGFVSEDRLLMHINKVSIDTLKLCMHEHYEDCPWREQGLYAYDSRNQIMYGYYVWGNYSFVRACLDLLGKSYDGKRYLELTSPGYTTLTIPVFTMVWITELYEYYLYSGSDELSHKWINQVDAIIDAALAEKVENMPELYHSGVGSKIWNFSEWNGEISSLKEHPQAPYNVYFCEAMRSAAKLHDSLGNTERAAFLHERAGALGKAVEKAFFSEKMQCYSAVAGKDDQGYEHIQAIMLANELVPAERQMLLHGKFHAGSLRGIDLSALLYLVRSMMKGNAWSRKFLVEYLRRILEPVVLSGATSLWETRQGATDFGYAGSLCHGWSSVMPGFCGMCILGVTPLEPGFKTFEVKPYAAGLTHASGSVPTPAGMIYVSWKKCDDGLHVLVRHPAGLKCVTSDYAECPAEEFKVSAYNEKEFAEPLWISHRGESMDAPENTIPAFALSLERNTDGMECDVHFTADGKVVCSHDGNTRRVGGTDAVIAEKSFDELLKIDVSNGKAGFTGTRIPLFADTLKYLGKNRQYFVEIKVTDPAMVQAVIEQLDAAGIAPEQVTVISFFDEVIKNFKAVAPERKALLLVGGNPVCSAAEVIDRLMACHADGVDIAAADNIDQEYVNIFHRAGYDFAVWTIDDPEKAARFAAMGVDAITSNCAAKLKKELAGK